MKRVLWGVALFFLLSCLTGCYGTFRATRAVYEWNRSFETRWAREATFVALQVVPAYGAAFAGDIFGFNLLEFWGWQFGERGPDEAPAESEGKGQK